MNGDLLSALELVVSAINFRNRIGWHSVNVANYSVQTAQLFGWSKSTIDEIRIGALLHDIGQLFFTDEMIEKHKDSLTTSELDLITRHPIEGANLIKRFPQLDFALPFVLWHQENIDGSGYPFRLKGNEIPIEVQIVAISDVYEALTHSRHYINRGAYSYSKTIQQMKLYRGKHWQENVFDAFLEASRKWK